MTATSCTLHNVTVDDVSKVTNPHSNLAPENDPDLDGNNITLTTKKVSEAAWVRPQMSEAAWVRPQMSEAAWVRPQNVCTLCVAVPIFWRTFCPFSLDMLRLAKNKLFKLLSDNDPDPYAKPCHSKPIFQGVDMEQT